MSEIFDYTSTPGWFRELLKTKKRIAIAGGPRAGKTTLAMGVRDRPVLSTDSYMSIDWENVPEVVNDAVSELPEFILEGVQVARCLRKGLKVDAVVYLGMPRVELTKGQETMRKACRTVFEEWLRSGAGVDVIEVPRG